MRRCTVWLCGIGLWLAGGSLLEAAPPPWQLGPPEEVVASAGVFEPLVPGGSYEMGAEFRFAPRRVRSFPEFLPELIPTAGLMAGAQGNLYLYGGFRFDFPLGQRWTLSPGAATGVYYRAASADLGGALEFRTGLELSYQLPEGARLGLCLYHLSNAGVSEVNPGSESLVVTYSAGLRRRR